MVTFEHVDKFVLTNLNLHIPEGEIVGIIGPSGAGKTAAAWKRVSHIA